MHEKTSIRGYAATFPNPARPTLHTIVQAFFQKEPIVGSASILIHCSLTYQPSTPNSSTPTHHTRRTHSSSTPHTP